MLTFEFIDADQLCDSTATNQLQQIMALYCQAGWWAANEEMQHHLVGLIRGSHCFLIACRQAEVLGMGRAISDRASDAYIQDVTVKAEWRHQRIGTRIIETLVARLRQDGLRWIGLIAEQGSAAFYQRLGFHPMTNAVALLKTE